MSGDIYFGFDQSKPNEESRNDGYVNSRTFDAFGDLLDEALAKKYPKILETIKEAEAMAIYNFCWLDAPDYNLAIHAIREYVAQLKEPTPWQEVGLWAWREMAEPFIHKDERYDTIFHQKEPAPS